MQRILSFAAIVRDFRTWLVLAFLVRLVGITDPPLENTHSWRQAFTNMVARTMAEDPIDLLQPRTDLAGERSDVVASEFPGFNACIAVVIRAFGPAHWYGRAIALILSTFGAWAFHALLLRRYGAWVAFNASFVLLWSSWFIYGRKAMPDTFSIALVLLALFFVDHALHRRAPVWFLLAVPLAALGGLCKIPSIVLFAPWGLMVMERTLPVRWRIGGLLALIVASLPVFWWYFHWQPHLLREYGNPLYFPVSVRDGFGELMSHGSLLMERLTFSALLSHMGFGALLWGLWNIHRASDRRTFLLIIAMTLPFGYFVLRTGSVFPLHAYYILPIVPLMALLAGIGLAAVPEGRWTILVLALIVLEGTGIRWKDLQGTNERAYLLRAEALADRYSDPHDLIVCTGGLDPRTMYFLHRKGWSLATGDLTSMDFLDSLQALGAKLVFVERLRMHEPLPLNLLYEDTDWRVYRTRGSASDRSDRVEVPEPIP